LKQSAAAQLSQAKSLAAQKPPVVGKATQGKPLNLAFTAVDGRQVDLSQMTGKVVLIDFWATWCGPCVGEMPHVRKAYKDLHDHGFEIVGISFDLDRKELTKFVAENDMPWPQYFDGHGWTNAINSQFQVRAIPTMYLVDKKGMLRDTNGRENLADKVRALLAEN
jgi:thiol-disulfide isomerase/thioredoxin